MTTYIVLPYPTEAVTQAAGTGDSEALAAAEAQKAAELFPERDLAAVFPSAISAGGAAEPWQHARTGLRLASSALGAADATEPGLEKRSSPGEVRFLEAVNAYLVEDLTPEERENVAGKAEVMENIEIGLVPPTDVPGEGDDNWHLEGINVRAAREEGLTGRGVRIGILDTGIDADHPEFNGKSVSFMEFDVSGFPVSNVPRDAGNHGTHVAGIAAGNACGVAPGANLAVAAVLTTANSQGELSGRLAQILAGFNWLVRGSGGAEDDKGGCPVVNASLGRTGFHDYLYLSAQLQLSTRRGSLLVAAIGNSGRSGIDNHTSPGNYNVALGVGAVDANGVVANFSDWGFESTYATPKPDLCAPGVDVRSAVPGGRYAAKSGTSMAAPAVAGAAALLIEKQPAYARNPASLKAALAALLVDSSDVGTPANFKEGFSRIGSGTLDLSRIGQC